MNSEIVYKQDKEGWIHWSSDSESGCFFPTDTTGRWDIYQAWLEAGNTPEPWQPETTVADAPVKDVIEDDGTRESSESDSAVSDIGETGEVVDDE